MANLTGDIKTYTPKDRFTLPFWKTWGIMFGNVIRSKDLIWFLFLKDLFANYRKSFLGSVWFILSPIIGIISWVFLNSTGFIDPGELEVPYVVYVLVGTSVWRLFINSYNAASGTLVNNKNIIVQVYYPHEAIFVQSMLNTLANFGVAFVINILVVILFGISLSWKIIFFPLVLIPLMIFGSAIGLIVALLGVVIEDLMKIFNMLMGLLMWITPVVYSTKIDSDLVQAIIPWNPLTYLVSSARDIVITGNLYEPQMFFVSCGLALVLFLIALRLFWVSENRLIERLV